MIEPLEHRPILEKLRDKSIEGRISWRVVPFEDSKFECDLENYKFSVWKRDERFGAEMEQFDAPPRDPREFGRPILGPGVKLLSIEAEEEIVFRSDERRETFELLTDLYELARRKALNVPEKLAGVAELLDRI